MLKHKDLSRTIIRGFYEVYNELGSGFLESVYENAFLIQLKKYGLKAEQQFPINVYFKEERVGEFRADLFVEGKFWSNLNLSHLFNRNMRHKL